MSDPFEHSELVTYLAGRIFDEWGKKGFIDGTDTSLQGDEDPEWRKAKLAVRTLLCVLPTEAQADGRE